MGRPALTDEKFINKAKAVHGNKYDYSKVKYTGSQNKVEIICPKHGSFLQRANNHLMGAGCPECLRESLAFTKEGFIRRARIVHGSKYDYSRVKYTNSKNKVEIICPVHGSFMQLAANHLKGMGCPACVGLKPVTTEDFIERAKKIHGDQYNYSHCNYVANIKDKVEIICPEHGPFLQSVDRHMRGVGCPKCAISRSMIGKEVYNKLTSVFGEDDVVKQFKSDVYPFYCDFYIRSRDMYIDSRYHWTHNDHPFDMDNRADADTVKEWKKRNTSYFEKAVLTWTKTDPKKRETAKTNGLNFLEFWDVKLSDLNEWISSGCPDGHDYDRMYSWKSQDSQDLPAKTETDAYLLEMGTMQKVDDKYILFCVSMEKFDRTYKTRFFFPSEEDAEMFHNSHLNTTAPMRVRVNRKDAAQYVNKTIKKISRLF